MMNKEDLIGQRFGRLTVIGVDTTKTSKNKYYICKCDCGNVKSVSRPNLHNNTRSCGCYAREIATRHGLGKHRIVSIYKCMVRRCTNPKDQAYSSYGGRGIKVCDEWLNDIHTFFDWAINNGYEENLTLDRIDNNGNYEPGNCRWTDKKTQSNNTRRNNHVIYEGQKYTLSELSRKLNISINTIYRYFDTERKVKTDNLYISGSRKVYKPTKTKADILQAVKG